MTRDPGYPQYPPQLGEQPDWPLGPVDFSGDVPPPPGYRCSICSAHGVRLWREYQTYASTLTLHCFDCAILRAGGPGRKYDWDIEHRGPNYTPDDGEIDGLVGAVPTAEGDTFWGYGSLYAEGVSWWWGLRPQPGAEWTHEQQLMAQRDSWRKCHKTTKRMGDYDRKLLNAWVHRGKDLEKRLTALGVKLEDWSPLR